MPATLVEGLASTQDLLKRLQNIKINPALIKGKIEVAKSRAMLCPKTSKMPQKIVSERVFIDLN